MTKKTFDAVKLMREIRDRLSQEMEQMTPQERLRHIRDRALSTSLGRQIGESLPGTVQHPDAANTNLRR